MSPMRAVFAGLIGACLVTGLVPGLALAASPASAPEWAALVEAARREGKVEVILSGQMPQKLRRAMPEFWKKFGIQVNFHTGGGRKHIERVLAERRVGRFTVDAWVGGASGALVSLIPNRILVPLDPLLVSPEVVDRKLWYKGTHHYTDPELRYIFTWGASPSYNVTINTSMVKPDEIRSYADLLDPKWKGKIVSRSPGQGSAAGSVPMFLNPRVGETWFRRWAQDMNVTLVTDARQGAEWVALGRFPIGMFGINTQAGRLAKEGFPVQGWLPHAMAEGEVLSASAANIMAFDRPPNPNAMKLFVNWALGRAAQGLFIRAGETSDSLRKDVDNSVIEAQYRIRPDREYLVSFTDPDYINGKEEVMKKLRKIMEEAGYK